MSEEDFRCGYVAIIGRPNVGKSTLLNHILGLKLSITSRKPQTTRHQILGVKTVDKGQFIFVDTPGIHSGGGKAINRYMNRAASSVIHDVDVILFLVQALKWTDEDDIVLKKLQQVEAPVILLVNKVDKVSDKDQLLPFIDAVSKKHSFRNILPISAMQGDNLQALEEYLLTLLPVSPPFFKGINILIVVCVFWWQKLFVRSWCASWAMNYLIKPQLKLSVIRMKKKSLEYMR